MKLITLNIEGQKHLTKIKPFLERENADVICLQEADLMAEQLLQNLGYQTVLLRNTKQIRNGIPYDEGCIIGSKHSFSHKTLYYYSIEADLPTYDERNKRFTHNQGCIIAEIEIGSEIFTVGTTHFTWTPDGNTPNEPQITDMNYFLQSVSKLPPHIMCGDFNIPRHQNRLYNELISVYIDQIPDIYKTSLDPNFHRLGTSKDHAIMFTDYMVDYIFTQSPYTAENVRLEFGFSDHAAVIADIEKTQ